MSCQISEGKYRKQLDEEEEEEEESSVDVTSQQLQSHTKHSFGHPVLEEGIDFSRRHKQSLIPDDVEFTDTKILTIKRIFPNQVLDEITGNRITILFFFSRD